MRRNHGFTLIEMMISITLGIIVIYGIGQIFVATRTSYASQQGLSGMQQNSRIGIRMMSDAVRNGGDMGFSNLSGLLLDKGGPTGMAANVTPSSSQHVYQLTDLDVAGPELAQLINMDSGITIYEYNGTAPGDEFELVDPLVPGAAGNWTPALPAPIAGRAMRFSDVIVTRYMSPHTVLADYEGAEQNVGGAAGGQSQCTAAGGITYGSASTMTPEVVAEINTRAKRLYAITDMRSANFFQAVNINGPNQPLALRSNLGVGFPGNIPGECGGLDRTSAAGGRIGEVFIEVYFVGMNADTGEPGLWRANFDGSGDSGFSFEELVEGVENLQITAGLTLLPDNPRKGISTAATDRIVTGADLTNPSNLGLAESLVVASRRIMSIRADRP